MGKRWWVDKMSDWADKVSGRGGQKVSACFMAVGT